LTKPGIIYGNDLSGIAGFLLASSLAGQFDFWLFVSFLIGMSLVICCGCVLNNYIDRGIDVKMQRTKRRALVTGEVKHWQAIVYGITLGVFGFAALIVGTNAITVILGAVGLFFYLVMYSFWKRHSPLGTVVGSVSGAIPITAGYTAVTGEIDAAAIILFVIMVCWQMPHFYAIASYRLKEYQAAGIPVLPAKHGEQATIAFTFACIALTLFNYIGLIFAVVMVIVGALWLRKGFSGLAKTNQAAWGRQLFGWSLVVLLVLCIMLPLGSVLP
jgi:protoheme IX farnesyltransferase